MAAGAIKGCGMTGRLLFFALITLSSNSAWAHNSCDLALVLKTEFARIAALAVSKKLFTPQLIQELKDAGPKAVLAKIPKTTDNLVFIQNLARLAPEPEQWPEVQKELSQILNHLNIENEAREESRQQTSLVLRPQNIKETDLPKSFRLDLNSKPAHLHYRYDQPVQVKAVHKVLHSFPYDFIEASDLNILSEHYATNSVGDLLLVTVLQAYLPRRWEETPQLRVINVTQKRDEWKWISTDMSTDWTSTSPFFKYEGQLCFMAFIDHGIKAMIFCERTGATPLIVFNPGLRNTSMSALVSLVGYDERRTPYVLVKINNRKRVYLRLLSEVQ